MYGSDWVMVGMVDDAYQYASRIRAAVARVFPDDAMEDFRRHNATRFLGLGRGGAARGRMEAFLGPTGGLLSRVDPEGGT
jgi:hypothetical protein